MPSAPKASEIQGKSWGWLKHLHKDKLMAVMWEKTENLQPPFQI